MPAQWPADCDLAALRTAARQPAQSLDNAELAALREAVAAGELALSEIADEQLRTFIGLQVHPDQVRAAVAARIEREDGAAYERARSRQREEYAATRSKLESARA